MHKRLYIYVLYIETRETTGATPMTKEAKEARREYIKKWQRDNPDKVKEYQARYWDKKAKEAAAGNDNKQAGAVIISEVQK